ncbi:bridging integrator 2a isoform X2 [Brienomyrus brachyistius]|uniref:bridging integrator 2a isoform X2 n=1 Tax=Brienomyrus brachyistius TaxID=42636 RepID=UPI0020B37266|nr:bridging integrator 2a isoform X2 [Brienomyrus brachyistius]
MEARNTPQACQDTKPKENEGDEEAAECMSTTGSPASAGVFAKRLQRQFSRAQEKVLQKLGKSEETKDKDFDLCCQNLNKQQTNGNRLFKDLKAYYSSVKVMRDTSKQLSRTLMGIYSSDLEREEDLSLVMAKEERLWSNFEEKLADGCIRIMDNYMNQFPEIKEKVAKRGRKLVDYDSSRHHLDMLYNSKKKDEAKIAKAQEDSNLAGEIFHDINTKLGEELTALYQSRIGCYIEVFENISSSRDIFYHEMCTLNQEVFSVMKSLEAQYPDEVSTIRALQCSGSKKRRSRVLSPIKTTFPALTRKFSFRQNERDKESDVANSKGANSALDLPSHTSPTVPRTLRAEDGAQSECTDSELNFTSGNEMWEENSEPNKTADKRSGENVDMEEEGEHSKERKNGLAKANHSHSADESGKLSENGFLQSPGDADSTEKEEGPNSDCPTSDKVDSDADSTDRSEAGNTAGFQNKLEDVEKRIT